MAIELPGRPDTELVVVVDCADLDRMAEFWSEVLGYRRGGTAEPYTAIRPPEGIPGIEILLQRVPDEKAGKNRLHLDIRVTDLDSEVDRVSALGATVLTDLPVREDGWTWHVLADPEGNEFCILRPPLA